MKEAVKVTTQKITLEIASKRRKIYSALNFTFRAIVPGIIGLAVWGAVKDNTIAVPSWLAWTPDSWEPMILQVVEISRNLSFGVFVLAAIFGLEAKDSLSKAVEEMKTRKRQVFSKNRTVLYLGAGIFLAVVYLFAVKAMIFCFGAGASSAVALVFEKKRNEYEDILHPLPGVVNNA